MLSGRSTMANNMFEPKAWATEILGTSPWEAVAVVLALAYLLLAVARNIWCWACAFVSTAIYLVLMAHAGLYMQTLLQVFYLATAVYGYWEWRRGENKEGEVAIEHWTGRQHVIAAVLVSIATVVNGVLLSRMADAHAPYLDAFVTWGSVVTTWMVARRVIENWLYWIVVDGVAAYLYFTQGLKATAVLFVIYIGIVIHGYFVWLRNEQRLRSTMVATASGP